MRLKDLNLLDSRNAVWESSRKTVSKVDMDVAAMHAVTEAVLLYHEIEHLIQSVIKGVY